MQIREKHVSPAAALAVIMSRFLRKHNKRDTIPADLGPVKGPALLKA